MDDSKINEDTHLLQNSVVSVCAAAAGERSSRDYKTMHDKLAKDS